MRENSNFFQVIKTFGTWNGWPICLREIPLEKVIIELIQNEFILYSYVHYYAPGERVSLL